MLIPRAVLDRIGRGEVTLAFRRWVKPTVKTGGTLRTAIGVLDIVRVEETTAASITEADAAKAGAPSLATLLGELERREGTLYRIELAYREPDPRIASRKRMSCPTRSSAISGSDFRGWISGPWCQRLDAPRPERHRTSSDAGRRGSGGAARFREGAAQDPRPQAQEPRPDGQPSPGLPLATRDDRSRAAAGYRFWNAMKMPTAATAARIAKAIFRAE